MRLGDIQVQAQEITVEGTRYVVTTGTGEIWYGRTGGEACFAYDAADVEALPDVDSYQSFCDRISPEEDRRLAIALAATHELRLTAPGSCSPVLSDEEYALVREAIGLAVQSEITVGMRVEAGVGGGHRMAK